MSFKERFTILCNENKVSPAFVCAQVGLSNSAYSKWTDESLPRQATLLRIADFFKVSVAYLCGIEEKVDELEQKALAILDEGSLNAQEKTLITMFRRTTEEGRLRIIQSIMNICDEIEKKDTTGNSSNVG